MLLKLLYIHLLEPNNELPNCTIGNVNTKFFKDANMEIIRCLSLQNKKDEAEQFLTNLELNEKSVVTNAFKDEALSVIKDNS